MNSSFLCFCLAPTVQMREGVDSEWQLVKAYVLKEQQNSKSSNLVRTSRLANMLAA